MNINKKIIARDIQGETVLLNKTNGDYFSLNIVGTDIYNCICDKMEIESIIDFLIDKYDINYDAVKKDVVALIAEMEENGILIEA